MPLSGPPLGLRLLRALTQRTPRGRYYLVDRFSGRQRFVGALGHDVGGLRFHCDMSDELCREAYLTGLYEPPVSRVIQRSLSAGGTMVDVGANWGYFSLVAAASVGPAGKVLAMEPDPRQFERLRANLALNTHAGIEAQQVAASAARGRAILQGYLEGDTNRGTSRISTGTTAGAGAFDVRCVTVDGITAALGRIDVVKIDVEGFEPEVIEGMAAGLRARRYHRIVLELHPDLLGQRGLDPAATIEMLQAHGYTGWTIDHTPTAYRRASDPGTTLESLLTPLDRWRETPWPHLIWRC
jgi:FkbM family methyltransferase